MTIYYGTSDYDTLTGTTGADEMHGLEGGDLYVIDHAGDEIVEDVDAGWDAAQVWILEYTMAANLEGAFAMSAAATTITGNALGNELYGNDGDDVLDGGDGDDWLEGRGGIDTMIGGDGDDFFLVEEEGDIVVETSTGGHDTVHVTATSYTMPAWVEDAEIFQYWEQLLAHSLTGNALDNYIILTWGSAQTIDGGDGMDTVSYEYEPTGYDLVVDLVTGVNGGVAADDVLTNVENIDGSWGDDELRGHDGVNVLDGGSGNDIISGRGGNDVILGGYGADVLSGGTGADSFVVRDWDTGTGSEADLILDFTPGGDMIDLSAIDADLVTGGDQAFSWVGSAAFSCVAGELRYGFDGVDTRIQGDLDGDGAADFEIVLAGAVTLAGADFYP